MDNITKIKWTLFGVLGLIGLFFVIMTYGALFASRKSGKYVSGVPCAGGFFLLIAGLLSPCKWLALLALTDYGVIGMLRMLIRRLIPHQQKQNDHTDEGE